MRHLVTRATLHGIIAAPTLHRFITRTLSACLPILLATVPSAAAPPALPVSGGDSRSSAAMRPLGELLSADGTLDLGGGYRGSIDPRGWRMTTNAGGTPHFAAAADSDDRFWAAGLGLPGVDAAVAVLAADGHGNLYAGGECYEAGGVVVNYIARWDGHTWHPLGSGTNATVNAIVVDGSGDVYVGGQFTMAGSVAANHVARWDGSTWHALGSGVNGSVYALAVDGQGKLYAGGEFNAAGGQLAYHIALWDGSAWYPLGSGTGDSVYALAMDSNGSLLAGGAFGAVGGVVAKHIARWDGSAWHPLGSGVNDTVFALAADGGGKLYAATGFTVALWDGKEWKEISDVDALVFALALDKSGNIYAGGLNFYDGLGYVAKWNGTTWQSLASGMDDAVYTLALEGSALYAGGGFTTLGGLVTNHIARWDSSAWNPLGCGTNYWIRALAADGKGNLYAAGAFTEAGGVVVNYVARWDGSAWHPLGSGLSGGDLFTDISALAVAGNGDLFVGGSFDSAGGVVAHNIARWDGSSWHALGSGVNSQVFSLAVDDIGNLYTGGNFDTAGEVLAHCVARWDGNSWHTLDRGLAGTVYALAVDGGGNLFAGGQFEFAGSLPAGYVARWDGSSWHALGSGLDGGVAALAVDSSGNLYAAGEWITTAGDVAVNNIARWDGDAWHALGSGLDAEIGALRVDGSDNLYAGGWFTSAGEAAANFVARWDGSSWSPLGSGLGADGAQVYALEVDGSGNLYAGGSFATAGGIPSSNIAIWKKFRANTPPDALDDTAVTVENAAITIRVLDNDTDPDRDPIDIESVSDPPHGTATRVGMTVVYAPDAGWIGDDVFTYAISDGMGGRDTATVAIVVKKQSLPQTVRLVSSGAVDGWILESVEGSNRGGTLNVGAATILMGDDAQDRQYRGILSFDSSGLPDDAMIVAATLRIKKQAIVGTSPFRTHGMLYADMISGAFSRNKSLTLTDFQASATRTAAVTVPSALTQSWHSVALGPQALPVINKTGLTQFRLRFAKDDNDDRSADYLSLYSGNAAASVRPILEVLYFLP